MREMDKINVPLSGSEMVKMRKFLGFTLDEMSNVLGVTLWTVRRWEKDAGTPPLMICEIYKKLKEKIEYYDNFWESKKIEKELNLPIFQDTCKYYADRYGINWFLGFVYSTNMLLWEEK